MFAFIDEVMLCTLHLMIITFVIFATKNIQSAIKNIFCRFGPQILTCLRLKYYSSMLYPLSSYVDCLDF